MSGNVEQRKIFQVSELNRSIKSCLEGTFGQVWLQGEVSNLRCPSSGHMYFTLKDSQAQIRAVMFRGNQAGMKVKLRDGIKVCAFGQITVYERGGDYQIIVRIVEEVGKGDLQAQFEELKKKLAAEGLFDQERKRKLPLLPQHIGVVTSGSGAAIRDVLNVLTRRFPNIHVLVIPVRVQGEGAALEISKGIDWLNRRGGIDVMIIGRGGGSLEDLWCFNEECVARAVARSDIPIISGVGHEIDFTISDFVADLRAPTPSAAAELVIGQKTDFEEQIRGLERKLCQHLKQRMLELRNRYTRARHSYVFREPANLLRSYMQHLDQVQLRAVAALTNAARDSRRRLEQLRASAVFYEPGRMLQESRHHLVQARTKMLALTGRRHETEKSRLERQLTLLRHNAVLKVGRDRARLEQCCRQLDALDPYAVINRGYSITYDEQGNIVTDASAVKPSEHIKTTLKGGTIESTVVRVKGSRK